jgi:Tol biopolymer transport system component
MELNPGQLLKDRYFIEKQLGKGGMGAVYLATDTAVDRKVAVKANLNLSPESQRQFTREARMLAGLRHPNLPLVSDHFVIEDTQYLVMDFVPGGNLLSLLREEGAQPFQLVANWAEQIGDALTYLHNQDPPIIHRDIKPANLKITPEGQIILVDFGIAKATAGDTTVGARGYTPGYAPPEQYSNAVTGPYSDQYALAATMYAMLTGGPPPESVALMLGEDRLAPARTISTAVPKHADKAMQRALSIEPDGRFDNVDQFVRAFKDPRYLSQIEKTLLSPSSKKRRKNNRLLIAVGSIIGVIIIGAATFFGYQALNSNGSSGPVAAAITDTTTALPPLPSDTPLPTFTPTFTPTPTLTLTPTITLTPTPNPTPQGNGGQIAFVSNRGEDGLFQIYLMDSDGSNVTQLTFDPVSKSTPMWSPDGTQLLYVADGGDGPYGTRYHLDIWVINADGSDPVNLTQSRRNDEDPEWTPDGTQIVFTSERADTNPQLFIMNADGSEVELISGGYASEYNPTFSPDGEYLAFSSTIYYTLSWRTGFNYGLVELIDIQRRIGRSIQPAWSPDGEFIAYVRNKTSGQEDIYILEAESRGAVITRLTFTSTSTDPAWSPDGQWIVYTSVPEPGNYEIFIMDRGGRFQTNLTNHPAEDRQPSWQPNPAD